MAERSERTGSESSSAAGSRAGSIGGMTKGLPRPKQNVKFSVGSNDDDVETTKRHILPELRLPESSDLGEASLSPRPGKELNEWISRRDAAAMSAFDKANRHASRVQRNNSLPSSRRSSLDTTTNLLSPSPKHLSPPQKALTDHPVRLDDIPLQGLGRNKEKRHYDLPGDDTDSDSENEKTEQKLKPQRTKHYDEARKLMRTFTSGMGLVPPTRVENDRSGTATPAVDQRSHEYEYVPAPEQYKPSVLSMLLASRFGQEAEAQTSLEARQEQTNYLAAKLAPFQDPTTDPRQQHADFFTRKQQPGSPGFLSGTISPYSVSGQTSTSGRATPKQKRPKWYKDETRRQSTGSIAKLLESASVAGTASAAPSTSSHYKPSISSHSPRSRMDNALDLVKNPVSHFRKASTSSRSAPPSYDIDVHINLANVLASKRYLLKMCEALMAYGAPTHRMEEYMTMAARKLLISAHFQYLPNVMIVSFIDPAMHTTEVHLIKEVTQVDLGKLKEIQEVYKDVIHEKYSVEEAIDDIYDIRQKKKRFGVLTLVFMYGIAAVSVGPYAFSARPIDFPISFVLGCLLGVLQLVWAPRSTQFSHIFEVAGTFATSFAARGFGSIPGSNGQPLFCFSALAQASIALILPGWIILSAALELQSRNIISGSIRMVYAIIYTLLLGFGTLIGTTIMGLVYPGATNDITCHTPDYWDASSTSWRLIYTKFIWVPIFTICLAMINQAKWRQMPWMVFISVCGYQVNYWSGLRFSQNIQVANALGAFCIGTLANLYSRLGHGVAAAAMLPAIFVMVPSGLAASGSLVAGLTSANQITHNVTGISVINNGTQGFYDAQNATTASAGSSASSTDLYGGTIFNVGYGMVQVAIGISVGLFLSALVLYPFGKKRSGIFSF